MIYVFLILSYLIGIIPAFKIMRAAHQRDPFTPSDTLIATLGVILWPLLMIIIFWRYHYVIERGLG